MTVVEILKLLTEEAKIYRGGCVESINRNSHMNNSGGKCTISQDDVDSVLVDFINSIAGRRWLDYGLYTKDLISNANQS